MTKRKIIIVLSGLGIVAFAFISMQLLASMKPTPPKRPPVEVVRYVKAESVEYSDMVSEIEAKGRLKSSSEIVISAEAAGEVLEGDIPFKKGQHFRKGDLLVKIYDEDDILLLKAKKSSFLTSIASVLPDFKITYTESYDNWIAFFESIDIDKDLPELPEIRSTQEKVLLASRNLLNDYYSIKSQEIILKRYKIYAPFNGTITDVTMEVGAVVNKGARLGQIINTSNMELEVPVELASAKWLKIGDAVKVQDESHSNVWDGKIIRKSKDVETTTQSISVFVGLKSTNSNPLYKGQYLTAKFSGIKLNDVMMLARNAVFNSNEVFIVADSVLAKKEIVVKKISRDNLYFNGLPVGTKLVTEPLINATENTKVKILGEEPAIKDEESEQIAQETNS